MRAHELGQRTVTCTGRACAAARYSFPACGGWGSDGCRCPAARRCGPSRPELPAAALLLPNCAADEGRDCTYYAVVGEEGRQGQAAPEAGVLLDSFEPPADFVISECCWAGW